MTRITLDGGDFSDALSGTVKITESTDPALAELAYNECSLALRTNRKIKKGMEIRIYFKHNDGTEEFFGLYYITNITDNDNGVLEITGHDVLGAKRLDDIPFDGMVAIASAWNLFPYAVNNLLRGVDTPVFDDNVKDLNVWGLIPRLISGDGGRREALKLICFGAGAVCDTSRSEHARFYKFDKDKTEKEIRPDRIFSVNSDENEDLTSTLFIDYISSFTIGEDREIFNGIVQGKSKKWFNEANQVSLELGDITNAVIHEKNEFFINFSPIDPEMPVIIRGREIIPNIFQHTTEDSLGNGIFSISETIVHSANVEEIARRFYDANNFRWNVTASILYGGERAGDKVAVFANRSVFAGYIEQITLNLSNIITADICVKANKRYFNAETRLNERIFGEEVDVAL